MYCPVEASRNEMVGNRTDVIDVVSTDDVEKKIKEEGYRMVPINEVDDGGRLRGNVLEALLNNNAWTSLQLDGGYIESRRLCADDTCEDKKMEFSLKYYDKNNNFLNYSSALPFAIMTKPNKQPPPGKFSSTNMANIN